MNLPLNKISRNRKGFSLVEVIASIVVLSLILISIIVLFAQSAKTTQTTDSIIDATYLAQSELEELYAKADQAKLSEQASVLASFNYSNVDTDGNSLGYYEKTDANSTDYIKLKITPIPNTSLTRVVIEVYDQKNGVMKSQMQNTLKWKAD